MFIFSAHRARLGQSGKTKTPSCKQEGIFHLYRHRSIFPGRRQPSIFDTDERNFCVRYGNRCDLIAISTNNFKYVTLYPQMGW